jgi:uncharacterized NAD-dependent epimerase/dehydratase family protein
MKRIVLLAHDKFSESDEAKTATGLLRYGHYDVRAVLDRSGAGRRVSDVHPGGPDVPIVAEMDAVEDEIDALVVGVASVGGQFDEAWRPDVRAALKRGCTVVAGLHDFLGEDEEFAALAEAHGGGFWDVRRPPDDLSVGRGVADRVDATVVLTVGTDCAVGKKTAALELTRAARARGERAAFVPTGQTGVLIAGRGTVVDAVPADFVAGAVEQMILDLGDDYDWLFVEGQGTIVHPGYSAVSCGLLHGAMPDALALCHAAGRETLHGYEAFDLPPLREYVQLHEALARPVHPTRVAAGALNTSALESDAAARRAVDRYASALDRPASDPLRFGVEPLLDALTDAVPADAQH